MGDKSIKIEKQTFIAQQNMQSSWTKTSRQSLYLRRKCGGFVSEVLASYWHSF